ncbi:MAG: hypothetical protein ACHQ49_03045 [Elusimicrobiota bacterium]
MKKETTPAKRTRRLVPLIHKPRRHGTRVWTTWVSESRMDTSDSYRHGPRQKGR